MPRRRYRISYLYITQEFIFSFLVAFLFFFGIFFVNQLLLLAEDILTRNVPLGAVLRLILYSLPSIVALSFPFGALVGSLMAVGRLVGNNEIQAFQASGVPTGRIFAPIAALGLVLSLGSFVMNDYLLPLGTLNFGRLYRELLYANPELELEPYSIRRYQDSTIITGNVRDNRIDDLLIIERGRDGERIILAGPSTISGDEAGGGVISLDLSSVFTHTRRNAGRYEYLQAEHMQYNILLRDITVALRTPGPREMSSYDVFVEMQKQEADLRVRRQAQAEEILRRTNELQLDYLGKLEALARGEVESGRVQNDLGTRLRELNRERDRVIFDRGLQLYSIEFHKKFSIPFACLSFVVFAFPVALRTGRRGRAVGFGLGLLVSVAYWAMILGGQTLGMERPEISPFLAMWFPNIVLLFLGLAMHVRWIRR